MSENNKMIGPPVFITETGKIKINPFMQYNEKCIKCTNKNCCMYCMGGDMYNEDGYKSRQKKIRPIKESQRMIDLRHLFDEICERVYKSSEIMDERTRKTLLLIVWKYKELGVYPTNETLDDIIKRINKSVEEYITKKIEQNKKSDK
jgi:hypothetical protein